jgi:hypothetical protein
LDFVVIVLVAPALVDFFTIKDGKYELDYGVAPEIAKTNFFLSIFRDLSLNLRRQFDLTRGACGHVNAKNKRTDFIKSSLPFGKTKTPFSAPETMAFASCVVAAAFSSTLYFVSTN